MTGVKAIIYAATHSNTGQQYVGSTTMSLDERRIKHVSKARKAAADPEGASKWHLQLSECPDDFVWSVLEEVDAQSRTEVAARESHWIAQLNTITTGFNTYKCSALTEEKALLEDGSNDKDDKRVKTVHRLRDLLKLESTVDFGKVVSAEDVSAAARFLADKDSGFELFRRRNKTAPDRATGDQVKLVNWVLASWRLSKLEESEPSGYVLAPIYAASRTEGVSRKRPLFLRDSPNQWRSVVCGDMVIPPPCIYSE